MSKIDAGMKNSWRNAWLGIQLSDGSLVSDVFVKVEVQGMARCVACSKQINYAGEGLKALRRHADSKIHRNVMKTRKENHLLPGKHCYIFKVCKCRCGCYEEF